MSTLLFGVVLAACLLAVRAPWAVVRSSARLAAIGLTEEGLAQEVDFAGSGAARRRSNGRLRRDRWGGRGRGRRSGHDGAGIATLDVVVLLDLLDAAIASGASLPRALGAVGQAVDEAVGTAGAEAPLSDGQVLRRAASALVMGADWQTAWQGSPDRLAAVVDGLAPTWVTGAAPGPGLRAAAERVRRERRAAAREAVGRLGVRLVLPLGLCFLPAFVLIGLVPVVLSLAAGLLG